MSASVTVEIVLNGAPRIVRCPRYTTEAGAIDRAAIRHYFVNKGHFVGALIAIQ